MPLLTDDQVREAVQQAADSKSRLSDIRKIGNNGSCIPSLDQNGSNYCWGHSVTHAIMLLRAKQGLPYVPLSAYAVAATIKNGRNEGGWGALALEFVTERGIPSQEFWPQGSRNLAHGTPECWQNALLHRPIEGWVDLQSPVYDRTMSRAQFRTCLATGLPVVMDANWWGHSFLGLELVFASQYRNETRMPSGKLATLSEFEKIWEMNEADGGYGTKILNSWSDKWKDNGEAILAGAHAYPDGAVAPRAVTPSMN